MPTTVRHRPRRYPSDTTIAEWALLGPLLPVEACRTKTVSYVVRRMSRL